MWKCQGLETVETVGEVLPGASSPSLKRGLMKEDGDGVWRLVFLGIVAIRKGKAGCKLALEKRHGEV